MKNQSVLTVNALAAVLVSGGLLSACAGESAGEPVDYNHQQPQRSDAEQRPSGSDYDRPLPNPAQPLPPEESGEIVDQNDDDDFDDDFGDDDIPGLEQPGGNNGGNCNDLCSGAGACTTHCMSLCDELPPGCESVARKIADCMGELGGDCNRAFINCATEHAEEAASCEDETADAF